MMKDKARERAWAAQTKARLAARQQNKKEVVVPPLAAHAMARILEHCESRKVR